MTFFCSVKIHTVTANINFRRFVCIWIRVKIKYMYICKCTAYLFDKAQFTAPHTTEASLTKSSWSLSWHLWHCIPAWQRLYAYKLTAINFIWTVKEDTGQAWSTRTLARTFCTLIVISSCRILRLRLIYILFWMDYLLSHYSVMYRRYTSIS